jgi:hypothetical protein
MDDTALVLTNENGKPLVVVQFPNDAAAIEFYNSTASKTYAGFELVTLMTPKEYTSHGR